MTGTDRRLITENRRARHAYHILERVEAGIALTGTEVKSLRDGGGNLREAYAVLRDGEVFLVGANIAPYKQGNIQNHDPVRDRKLLLHRREIDKFAGKASQQGYTLVPLKLYFKAGRAKIEIAVARGKKQYDKRDVKKKAEAAREIRKAMKDRRR